MAKKATVTEGKDFDFMKMDAALSKIPGFEFGSVIETNTFSEVDEWIPTGNYLLNACVSGSIFGGIPNSRSIGLAGDPETGKTFLCLNLCREAQKMGYSVIYCETEGAIDRATVRKFGIDTNALRYQPIKTVNQFKRFVVATLEMVKKARSEGQKPKIMIVLDSLGMLTTEKEINDAIEGKDAMDMGIKAKQMRSMFRMITLDMAGCKIPLIATNHTTTVGIGSYVGPSKDAAGGDGPIFSLSTVLILSKKFEIEGDGKDKKKTGIVITVKPRKSRSTIPTTVTIHVSFTGGMNPYVGLEEFVNWEACGIEKGKIYTEKEYEKEKPAGVAHRFVHETDKVDKKTGEITGKEVQNLVFVPKETGRWCVKHLGKSLASAAYLLSPQIYTDEVLKALDENVIKHAFLLPEHSDAELEGVMAETDEEEGEDE